MAGGREHLLERERELASLESLIDGVADGGGRLVLIEGQAGIGKSRLLAEVRERAEEAGLRVLAGRGSQLERQFAYGVVRQLFEPLVLAEPDGEWFAGAAATARPVFETLASPDGDEPGDASFAALHGLYWLTVNLGEQQPLLLAIDDIHWTDRASLRFLAYLAHRLEGLPIVVAVTLRTAEPSADETLVADIAHDPATVTVQPGPLSAPAVAALVADVLGAEPDEAFCGACHRVTGGNPLLLRQLLRSLDAEGVEPRARNVAVVRDIGPRAVSRTVLLRLARLSREAQAVAGAAAVLGESADLPTVAALAEIDERVAAEATADLARAEILRPDPPLGFVHPLIRDVVYQEIPPGTREMQHGRAAEMLREAGASPEKVAAQLLAAPGRGEAWVVDLLREAARVAGRKGGAESAVAYLQRALDEPPPPEQRPELLLEIGLAEERTSGPAAAEHLRAAYETIEDPVERGRAATALARTVLFAESPELGYEVARRAAAELPEELVDLRQSLEALELFTTFFGVGDPAELARLERWRTERPAPGPGGDMLMALAAFHWALAAGPADACAALALESLASGHLIRSGDGLFSVAAIYPLMIADRREALESWDAMLAEVHGHGSLFTVLTIHLFRGYTLLLHGDLAEADESIWTAAEEIAIWGSYGNDPTNSYHLSYRVIAGIERGDLDGARRLLDSLARPTGHSDGANYLRRAWIEYLLATGAPEEALPIAEEFERSVLWTQNPAVAPWRGLKAQTLDALGRTDEALPLAEEELELARQWGAPSTVGRALRNLGTLKREAGLPLLEEAVEVLEDSPAKLERAKALAALGGALRRGRRPTDAREPLRRALELADVCGAEPLAANIRVELKAAGVRPRTSALQGVESLTASERRVAELAAAGHTNSEIAQTLFVTPKTVEVHLTNGYRKLGIRSRRQLPAVLEAA